MDTNPRSTGLSVVSGTKGVGLASDNSLKFGKGARHFDVDSTSFSTEIILGGNLV